MASKRTQVKARIAQRSNNQHTLFYRQRLVIPSQEVESWEWLDRGSRRCAAGRCLFGQPPLQANVFLAEPSCKHAQTRGPNSTEFAVLVKVRTVLPVAESRATGGRGVLEAKCYTLSGGDSSLHLVLGHFDSSSRQPATVLNISTERYRYLPGCKNELQLVLSA